jgi:hypothetical protein
VPNSAIRTREATSLVWFLVFCPPELVLPLLLVRFFTALDWKAKFADMAAELAERKAELQFNLTLYVGITVARRENTLEDARSEAMATFTFVFEKMSSPEECEFEAVVRSKGGREVILENEELLGDALGKYMPPKSAHEAKQKLGGVDAEMKPSILLREIGKTPDMVVKENAEAFQQKFSAALSKVEAELKEAGERQSDRVMKMLEGGPHDRIENQVGLPTNMNTVHPHLISSSQDLRYLWKEMVRRRVQFGSVDQLDSGLEG